MNPFDLRGPEFLLFYLGTAVMTLAALVILRKTRESGRSYPQPKLSDPYLIAYLRGGSSAAIESAVVSLVDRKILDAGSDGVMCRKGLKSSLFVDPLERGIVEALGQPLPANKLLAKKFVMVFGRYDHILGSLGLIPDAAEKWTRMRDALAACLFLAAVAGIKIVVALSRGRTNLAFLIILAVLSLIAVVVVGNPRITRRGKNVLEDLKTLFDGLKARADYLTEGHSAAELALLAALFGAAILPLNAFPLREKLFPVQTSSGDSGGGSSCSSSSSSGGGGCGGGGCGGCGS